MTPKELLEVADYLEETPRFVKQIVDSLSPNELKQKLSEDEFSVLENVCHLRDIEREGYSIRISRILTETNPFLPDIDGGRLAAEREYNQQEIATALADFASARQTNVHRIRALSPDQLGRTGMFEGTGTVTLERLILMMRDHDAGHRNDVGGSLRGRPVPRQRGAA
jgi:DinB family protein